MQRVEIGGSHVGEGAKELVLIAAVLAVRRAPANPLFTLR